MCLVLYLSYLSLLILLFYAGLVTSHNYLQLFIRRLRGGGPVFLFINQFLGDEIIGQ